MLGLGFALTNFGTKGGVVDTPDLSGSSAAALLAAYGGEGFSMIFDSTAPSIKITDSTTPSNDWDSDLGDGYSVQDFFKSRSFTSYSGPVSTGKRLMQADGYIKPCRHNLLPMSNRFGSGAWTRTAVTSTYGQTDADGGSTASLITESNTATSVLYTTTAFTTAANVPYTISVKIKKGNSTWVRLAFGTSGGTFTNGVQQWYNLDTVATGTAATTGTASYISSSITATTNSYYILTLTASQASTTGAFIVSTATADASATRTTSGTYYIYQAMCNAGSQRLEYVSSEAHNLVIQSRTLGTSWTATDITVGNNATTSPDGTTSAESLTEGTAGTALLRSTAFTVPASSTVTAYFYLKTSTATWVRVTLADGSDTNGVRQWFNLSTGAKGTLTAIGSGTATSSAITACANGWYRCEITGVCSTSTSLTMSVSSASADASNTRVNSVVYYADCAQAELATSAGKVTTTTTTSVYNPHFDLPVEYNTDGTVKALTREEARTNLILHSRDMTQASAWTVSAASTNATAARNATGIDGVSNTACTLTDDSDNGAHYAQTGSVATTSGTTYTVSVYAKAGTKSWLRLAFRSAEFGSPNSGWFNLATGVVGSADAGTTISIKSAGNGWYLCSASRAATATSTSVCYIAMQTADNETTYTGDGTGTMYFDCAQFEAGSTASSPIVTGSATVTRAADVITIAKTVVPGTSTYTLYSKSLHHQTTAAYYGNMMVSSADSNNYMGIALYDYDVRAGAATSAVTQADMVGATNGWTAEVTHKVAARLSDNDSRAYLDGSAIAAADTSCTMPTAVYNIELGSRSAASHSTVDFYEVMVLPTGAVDATLATLTTA